MKTFVNYVKEALEGSTKLTIEWMKEHYEKYNKELFNNELPAKIDLGFTNKKESALGLQGFNKTFWYNKKKMRNDMYIMCKPTATVYITPKGTSSSLEEVNDIMYFEPYIKMNPRYDFSDFQKEDTIIHEMVHLYNHKDCLAPKRSHGKEFKAKCNEVRALAKKLYGVEYDLGTRAKNHDEPEKDFQMSDEWKAEVKKEIEATAQKGGGVYGVLVYYNKEKMPKDLMFQIKLLKYTKRFVFCTRNMLEKVLRQAKAQKGVEKILIASPIAYTKYCDKYGKFRTVNSFSRFWDINDYDEQIFKDNTVKEEIINESLNEGLMDWVKNLIKKVMDVFVKIKGGTPTSAINLEDYIEDVEKIEDKEREGCPETDKKMIKGE